MRRLDFVQFTDRKWSDGEAVGKSVNSTVGTVWLCDLTSVKKKKRTHVSTCKTTRVLLTHRHIVLLLLVTRCLLPKVTAARSMWHDGSWMTKTAGNEASEEKIQQPGISPCRRGAEVQSYSVYRGGTFTFTAPLLPRCNLSAEVSLMRRYKWLSCGQESCQSWLRTTLTHVTSSI